MPHPGLSEAAVQQSIVELCAIFRLPCLRMPAGIYRSMDSKRVANGVPAGIPDLCVICPDGKTLWIEVKKPGGKLSKVQRACHEEYARLGHEVLVARSSADVEKALVKKGAIAECYGKW